MNPDLVARIKLDEGLRLQPYKDTVGQVTIGYGRNLSDKGISQLEADYLLENDLEDVLAICATYPWFAGLSPARQIVIASMVFNMGPYRFSLFKNMIAALQRMDYETAADEMLASRWVGQVKDRASRLAQMMREG